MRPTRARVCGGVGGAEPRRGGGLAAGSAATRHPALHSGADSGQGAARDGGGARAAPATAARCLRAAGWVLLFRQPPARLTPTPLPPAGQAGHQALHQALHPSSPASCEPGQHPLTRPTQLKAMLNIFYHKNVSFYHFPRDDTYIMEI